MPAPKANGDQIDTRLIRRLADILNDTALTEIEVEHQGLKIRVARSTTMTAQAPAPVHVATQAPAVAAPPPSAPATPEAAPPAAETGDAVKSPMVGTVYLQPQPGAPPFVKPGDSVTEGQTLMLVEAMKTMNPIAAPRAGKVARILVTDAQPVEFGEPLIVLE
jgi:acetyl-CoA carboxylase biotin carboxyl carrier protein